MGIDVYLRWDGMTEEDKDKQFTGSSTIHGHVGYLREAYHGEPYATEALISEDWSKQPEEGFIIPNKVLEERLPEVAGLIVKREVKLYGSSVEMAMEVVRSFIDFVDLHEKLELEGKNPRIVISY